MATLTSDAYVLDSDSRVWKRRDANPEFGYSDGTAVEKYMAEVLRNASDLATDSLELRRAIRDWPTLVHLDAGRANLLRPLEKHLKGSVLEIGAGCGAITRYLGECGASVVSLEGSSRRAAIAASRCRDLPNVQVYCDNVANLQTDTRFDVVALIGVLEYSRVFIDGADPVRKMLSYCAEFLQPDGLLIVAIENQLGLKYFAGAFEDHTARAFHGIMDLYTSNSPVTFGRRELTRRLRESGFANCKFLYPLPDYKLPELILHEEAFAEESLDFFGLLQAASARNQARDYDRLFAEATAWPVLVRNGLAQDFANSFLVVAGKSELPGFDPADLVHFYASKRQRSFNKATHIRSEQSGLIARRQKLHEGEGGAEGKYRQVLVDEPLIAGELYVNELVRIINRPGWTTETLAVWAKPWLDFLAAKAVTDGEPDTSENADPRELWLPGNYLDCAPFNVIKTPDNELRTFDLEFVTDEPVEFSCVAFRGLYHSLARQTSVASSKSSRRILSLIAEIMELAGWPLTRRQIDNAAAREAEFLTTVGGLAVRPGSITRAKVSMRPESHTRRGLIGRLASRGKGVLRRLRYGRFWDSLAKLAGR